MNPLTVVTPPSIYRGSSTQKMFWEEKFTGEKKFTLGEVSDVNMKNYGSCNVWIQIYIKGSDKYVTLDILVKFFSLDMMRITSSDPKDNLGRSVKGLITSLGIKSKARPNKCKKVRYAIGNVSMKDLSMIIREFEKLLYKSYESRMPKHEPTDSYVYPAVVTLPSIYHGSFFWQKI